jgi:hypothetical protein
MAYVFIYLKTQWDASPEKMPVPNFMQIGRNSKNASTIAVTLQAKYVFYHTLFHDTLSINNYGWGFSIQNVVKTINDAA